MRVEAAPVAGGLAGAAVDDQVVGALGDLGVEVVLQHPQRRLRLPAAARSAVGAARGADGAGAVHGCSSAQVVSAGRVPVAASSGAVGRTRPTTASISGARWRSGPGPADAGRADGVAHGAGRGRRARAARAGRARGPRSASRSASTRVRPSTARRSLRAAFQPIETWSSCIAEDGIESTLAGTASRLSSLTIPAGGVLRDHVARSRRRGRAARNGGSPLLRAVSSMRSVRRSVIEATSATAMARKSST